MSSEITVELKTVSGQKSRKARASVTLDTDLGELTIAQISVIHQDGKEPWVALPTIDFEDKQNPGKYVRLDTVLPGHRLKKAISDAVLAKYRELSDAPF